MSDPKVRIRFAALRDLDDIMTWINDPEVVAHIANIKPPISREQESAWLRMTMVSETDRLYSFEDSKTGAYVGQGGIHQIYWPARSGRLALIIKKKFQGCGYGKAAMRELMRMGFDELKLHKLWSIVREDNPKTVHLNCDVLGFRKEGRLIDEYAVDGRYHTMLRLAMLEQEYRGSSR